MESAEMRGYTYVRHLSKSGEGDVCLYEKGGTFYSVKTVSRLNDEQAGILNRIRSFENGYFPRIVECIDADGQTIIIMEYIDGTTLQDEIQKNGTFSFRRAREIFLEICQPGADGPGSFTVRAASADGPGRVVRFYAEALRGASIASEEQHGNTFLFRGTAGEYAFEISVEPAAGDEGKAYKSVVVISAEPAPADTAPEARQTERPAVQSGPLWQATAGGGDNECANCIEGTKDGGAVMAGYTRSAAGSDESVYDGYVVKFSADGQVEWENAYGGVSDDEIYSIECTVDGGYVFAGASDSGEGQTERTEGHPYFWVVKLAADGAVEWSKTWGGTQWDEFRCVEITEYGYLVAGFTQSFGGDVGQTYGNSDVWVAKVSADGELLWKETYGGGDRDEARAVLETDGGGFVVAGFTQSAEGNVEGWHEGESYGYKTQDYWVVKVSAEGKTEWARCLGGSGMDQAAGLIRSDDGAFIVCGTTDSSDGDVTGWHKGYSAPQVPSEDVWAVCLTPSGEISWERASGASQSEMAAGIVPAADGSMLIGGAVDSSGNGNFDFWLARYAN